MTTTGIKKQLTEAINKIDDTDFLEALQIIVNSKKDEESASQLSASQKKELDKRLKSHKSDQSKSYTWPEVKKSLLKK
ncbi:MAG: addiction module protein [Chitinophagaceae bacterium]